MLRIYVCPRYPTIQLGDRVKFENGFFKTDSLMIQRLIEKHDWFGWNIALVPESSREDVEAALDTSSDAGKPFNIDLVEGTPSESDPPIDENEFNEIIDDMFTGDEEEERELENEFIEFADLTKSKLNAMRVADLTASADTVGIEGEVNDMTKVTLLRVISKQLEL